MKILAALIIAAFALAITACSEIADNDIGQGRHVNDFAAAPPVTDDLSVPDDEPEPEPIEETPTPHPYAIALQAYLDTAGEITPTAVLFDLDGDGNDEMIILEWGQFVRAYGFVDGELMESVIEEQGVGYITAYISNDYLLIMDCQKSSHGSEHYIYEYISGVMHLLATARYDSPWPAGDDGYDPAYYSVNGVELSEDQYNSWFHERGLESNIVWTDFETALLVIRTWVIENGYGPVGVDLVDHSQLILAMTDEAAGQPTSE